MTIPRRSPGWRAMHFVSASPFASNAVDAAEMLIEAGGMVTPPRSLTVRPPKNGGWLEKMTTFPILKKKRYVTLFRGETYVKLRVKGNLLGLGWFFFFG